MLKNYCAVLVTLAAITLALPCFANEPQPTKPNAGPAAVDRPATPKEDPEAAAHKRHSDVVNAQDKADRLRAKYEKDHKPGPIPEGADKQFEEVLEAYRTAIDIDPRDELANYCRLRLSGAYTYTGDYEAGLRVLTEAVNVAASPKEQIQACNEVAYHLLQAMHKPADALRWFRRSESLIAKLTDNQEKSKWQAATSEGIARCERESAK